MRRLGMRTLRARIAVWYGAIIAVCLLGYSAAVGASFARHVWNELDHRVHEDIELAARAVSVDASGRPSWPAGYLTKQIEEEEGGGHWVEIWDFGGNRLLTVGTFRPELLSAPRSEEPPRTMQTRAGPVRVKTEAVQIEKATFFVRAAVSEESARRQILSLWRELAAISLAVLVLGGIGGIFLAHRLLGPLARMAERAHRITAEELHQRLEVEVAGEELEQLRDSFNATLARLERSFEQLRRFTADASHEIRTPLTALRSVGEVALQGQTSNEQYREVIGTMLEEVDRLSRLAGELLTIARTEAGQTQYTFEPLDLGQLARGVAEQLEVLAEERQQKLVLQTERGVIVDGDRLALRQAVMNLIDNAIKYSPEGAEVSVVVRNADSAGVIEVRDHGPGIPPEHRGKIFERFYRIDPGRSREMGGTGLGLSLVKLTADGHGARVEVEGPPDGGSLFRLVLPRR